MSREANIAAQVRLIEHVNAGHVDAAVQSFAEDAVSHGFSLPREPGRAGFEQFFNAVRTGFPDAHIEVARIVGDDEHVSVGYTLTGTHSGEFHGLAATGRTIEVRSLQVGRFENGQIVEQWGTSDELAILGELGILDELEEFALDESPPTTACRRLRWDDKPRGRHSRADQRCFGRPTGPLGRTRTFGRGATGHERSTLSGSLAAGVAAEQCRAGRRRVCRRGEDSSG